MRALLERLTVSSLNYWGSFVLDGAVGVAMIAVGIVRTAAGPLNSRLAASVVLAIVGLGGFAACSFVEYAFHRWLFHAPYAPTAQRLHTLHHRRPRTMIATPFFVSLITCAVTWGLCCCVTSRVFAGSFAGGMLLGHAFEGGVHHLLHHGSPAGSRWLRRMKRRHLLHHHRRGDENFGVASSVWDRIFRTESADVRIANDSGVEKAGF